MATVSEVAWGKRWCFCVLMFFTITVTVTITITILTTTTTTALTIVTRLLSLMLLLSIFVLIMIVFVWFVQIVSRKRLELNTFQPMVQRFRWTCVSLGISQPKGSSPKYFSWSTVTGCSNQGPSNASNVRLASYNTMGESAHKLLFNHFKQAKCCPLRRPKKTWLFGWSRRLYYRIAWVQQEVIVRIPIDQPVQQNVTRLLFHCSGG